MYMFFSPRIIVDKIDKDGDDRITEEELVDWIRHVSRRYNIKGSKCQTAGFLSAQNLGKILRKSNAF